MESSRRNRYCFEIVQEVRDSLITRYQAGFFMPAAERASSFLERMNLFFYRAEITRVIDGDTVVADVDLGMGIWQHDLRLRLFGINTPELHGADREAGQQAKAWLVSRLKNSVIMVQSHKDRTGKYGRYLATVFADGEDVNAEMLRLKLGVPM